MKNTILELNKQSIYYIVTILDTIFGLIYMKYVLFSSNILYTIWSEVVCGTPANVSEYVQVDSYCD